MNTVQPIRDPDIVEAIAEELKEKSERNYIMFILGINTALRISDILKLRVRDVENTHINIRAKKTNKETRIYINNTLKLALKDYISNSKLKSSNYLFCPKNNGKFRTVKPISREQAYKILNKIGKKYRLDSIGTHTLRKTFGYHFYIQTKDIAALQKILSHSNEKETMRYIGIIQDTIDSSYKNFKIGKK